MLVPQSKFLQFLAGEASKYPEFDLRFSSKVESLIDENGSVCGVRYMGSDGLHDINAPIVIGADGRFSTVRERAGLVPIKTSPPMDILWFMKLVPVQGPLDTAAGRMNPKAKSPVVE